MKTQRPTFSESCSICLDWDIQTIFETWSHIVVSIVFLTISRKGPDTRLAFRSGSKLLLVRRIVEDFFLSSVNAILAGTEFLWNNFAQNMETSVSYSLDVISCAVFEELKCMNITCDDIGKLSGLPDCSSEGVYKSIPEANLSSTAEYSPEEFLGQSHEP